MTHGNLRWLQGTYFSKYVLVGMVNSIICFVSFAALVFYGVHYIVASLVSYALGVTNSYVWNKYFTFRRTGGNRTELVRFFSVYAAQYIIGLVGLIVLVELVRLRPIASQTVILAISVLFSFFAHKHWTFRVNPTPRAGNQQHG